MSRCLIDTNIVSAYFRGDPPVVVPLENAERLYLPVIVLGELAYGAHHSSAPEKHFRRISTLLGIVELVDVDADTAKIYGQLREDMGRAGRIIPQNDWWIASIALQHNLPLVSRDGHFAGVPGLTLWSWSL